MSLFNSRSTASTAPPQHHQQQEAELAVACLRAVASNPAALERIKAAAAQGRQQGGSQQPEAEQLPLEQLVTAFVRAIMDTQQVLDRCLSVPFLT